MNSGLNPANPILVPAFRSALVHQREDLGFPGGLGTDPNSMIPLIVLFTAGYLVLTPVPQAAPAFSVPPAEEAGATVTAVTPAPPGSVPIQYGSSG
jgi:hypothetical protein